MKPLTLSPETVTPTLVPKKKKRGSLAEFDKPKLGRPKTLPKELDTRYQIRCSARDMEIWKELAYKNGYDVSGWIRKIANDVAKRQSR